MQLKENKVLIHCCCAICSAYPIKLLKELGYNPIAYFYNPNIYPSLEFQKRLDAQKKLCKSLECELIEEEYLPEFYDEIMQGYENDKEGGERCTRCFELRLLKTVQKANELGIKNYTTSIPISPHKNYNLISTIGEKFSKYYNINYLAIDFKKKDGLLKSNKIANDLKLYRQNYCGCSVSAKRLESSAPTENLIDKA